MADLSRMERALRNADAAGDVEAAKVIARALKQAMATTPTPAAPEPSMLENAAGYVNKLGQSVAQGAAFGFMDEIAARLDSPFVAGYRSLVKGQPFDTEKAYDDRLQAYRGDQEEFRRDNPVSAFAGEAAGAVAGTLANPILRAATAAPAGASVLGNMARGGGVGAGVGAAYGFGNAEGGLENRAVGAGTGAVVGGVVGAAAPAVVEGIKKGGQLVADHTINRLPFRQAGAAERKVAEALMRDGLTPEQAALRIKEMGPEAALMDLGENVRGLARSAYTIPGEGKTKVGDFLKARQEGVRGPNNEMVGGQSARITSGLDDLVPEQYTAAERRGLENTRTTKTRPTYESVVNNPQNLIPDEKFAAVANDPYIKSAIKTVKKSNLYGLADFPNNSMPVIDAAKKEIDDMIGVAQRAGRKNEARLLIGKKEALVGVADEAFPDYAKVREVWSDFAGVIDAGDLGRKFLRGEIDSLKDAVSRMTDAERNQFRIGVVQGIRDKVGSLVNRSDATKKLMDIPVLEKKIQTAFGDEAMFKKYIDMLQNERAMFDSYGKILGGSRTGEVLAEQADTGVDKGRIAQGVVGMLNPASPTGFVRGVGDVLGGVRDRATISGPMSRNLGDLLTGQGVDKLKKAMDSAKMSEAQRQAIMRVLQSSGVVGGGRTAPQGQ